MKKSIKYFIEIYNENYKCWYRNGQELDNLKRDKKQMNDLKQEECSPKNKVRLIKESIITEVIKN